MSRHRGALALVLHSHMPYVEGFGTWPFGEEWLWEAVATVYLPLLDGDRRAAGHARAHAGAVRPARDAARRGRRAPAELPARGARADPPGGRRRPGAPTARTSWPPRCARAAGDYAGAERELASDRDVLAAPGARSTAWSCGPRPPATRCCRCWPPTPGLRLQLATGIASHERRFGSWGGGFWLPECAYEPGLERELAEHGVRAFCVDQTAALGHGALDQLEPVATEAGPVAVPIDWATVELVWNDKTGYPAHGDYRNYWGRTVHDLKPWDNGGRPVQAQPRRGARARARARLRGQVDRAPRRLRRRARPARPALLRARHRAARALVVRGHRVARGGAGGGAGAGARPRDRVRGARARAGGGAPAGASTWGTSKDLSTWDAPEVAELGFAARRAELRTVAAAAGGHVPRPALERAARELLALQASDWAFMVTRDLAADYPQRRVAEHEAAHARGAGDGAAGDPELRNLAPGLELASILAP